MSRKMREFLRQVSAKKHTMGAIAIFMLMVVVAFSSMLVLVPETVKGATGDFTNHKLITIDNTKVGAALSNFPVWVYNVSDDFKDSSNGGVIQPDGDDIAFYSFDNNTQYNHEIEMYDGTTGTIGIWVNVTSVSGGADTKLWIYYGDADGNNQEDVAGTWDADYLAVYHFANASGDLKDSTSNNKQGTAYNTPTYQQTGKVGYAINFSGEPSGDGFSLPDSMIQTTDDVTVFMLAKADAWNATAGAKNRIYYNNYGAKMTFEYYQTTDILHTQYDSGNWIDQTFVSAPNLDTWYFLTFTYDQNGVANVYLNGSFVATDADTGAFDANVFNNTVGFDDAGPKTGFWDGLIDEIRISTTPRTSDWIYATYNTTNSPSTFLTFEPGEEGDLSTFTIKGLPNDIITFAGVAGTSVFCNSSGDTNEWLECNMSINATDNITELWVYMDDLNDTSAYINASNITMYVSSDNSSYGEMGTFTDGGSNCSNAINSTNWNAGTMGTNPFSGAGLTDKNTSIYLIFKITIPVGTLTDIFWASSSDACKIYPGYYA